MVVSPFKPIVPSPRRTVLSLSLQSEPPGGPVRGARNPVKIRGTQKKFQVNSPATTEEETPMQGTEIESAFRVTMCR